MLSTNNAHATRDAKMLRPIYDLIERGQYKQALRRLRSLRKGDGTAIVKALKAHCLERTGHCDEALAYCREVQATRPVDEIVLNTLKIVYTCAGLPGEITACYKNAIDQLEFAHPGTEELARQYFFCLVRDGDFKNQQRVAMKLFKSFGNPKYMLWAATALALRAIVPARGGVAGPGDPNLKLAGMLVEKMRAQGHLRASGAVELSLEILQRQRKFVQALSAVRGGEMSHPQRPVASSNPPPTLRRTDAGGPCLGMLRPQRTKRIAQLAAAAGEFCVSQVAYRGVLETYDADDWQSYSGYIDAVTAAVLRKCLAAQDGERVESAPRCDGVSPNTMPHGLGGRALSSLTAGAIPGTRYGPPARRVDHICNTGSVATAINFLAQMGRSELTCGRGHLSKRGPFLALLAFEHRLLRLVCCELSIELQPWLLFRRLARDIVAYIRNFGDRACCFSDVCPFLNWFLPGTALAANEEGRCGASIHDTVENAMENAQQHVLGGGAKRGGGHSIGIDGVADGSIRAEFTPRAPVIFRSHICAMLARLAANNACPWHDQGGGGRQRPSRVDVRIAQRRLRRYTTAQQLLWYLGGYRNVSPGALARRLMTEYVRALDHGVNSGTEGGQREVQHGDDLVVLSAHIMMAAAKKSLARESQGKFGGRAALLDAAALLECGRLNSRFNFQIDLALIEVYGQPEICACEPLVHAFNNLGIKHVQLDSLSYLVMPHALRGGFYEEAATAARNVCRFNRNCAREFPEYVVRALGNENYHKALEIVRFQRKVRQSHQFAVAWCVLTPLMLLERRHLQSLALAHELLAERLSSSGGPLLPMIDGVETLDGLSQLSANYDFSLRATWDCPARNLTRADNVVTKDNIASGAHRNAVQSPPSMAAWRARSWSWLRLHGAQGAPRALLCAFKRDAGGLNSAIQRILGALSALGFVPATLASASLDCVQARLVSVDLATTPTPQLCWYLGIGALTATHAVLRAMEARGTREHVAQSALPADGPREWERAIDAFVCVARVAEHVGGAIATGIAKCVTRCDPQYLAVTSGMLYQAGLWACLTTSICAKIVPRPAGGKVARMPIDGGKVATLKAAQQALKRQVRSVSNAWQVIIRSVQAAIAVLEAPARTAALHSGTRPSRGGRCWDGRMPGSCFDGSNETHSLLPPGTVNCAFASGTTQGLRSARINRMGTWENIRRSHCESYKRILMVLKDQRAALKAINF